MSTTRAFLGLFLLASALSAACSDTAGGANTNATNVGSTNGGTASGGTASGGTASALAGSSSVSGNSTANGGASVTAGAAGSGSALAAGSGGVAGASQAGLGGAAGSVAAGAGGSANGGQAGAAGASGFGGNAPALCTKLDGTARPAFSAPAAGCGTEALGIRPEIAQQVSVRAVCPSVPAVGSAMGANCPAANPNDNLPDDDALQACLNRGGTTVLLAGSPGYILAKGIKILNSGETLRGTDIDHKARLVAAATLKDTMVRADTVTDIVVRYLELDGNRDARTGSLGMCAGYRIWATGLAVRYSRNFVVADNHILNTLCGSSLEIDGSDFEIARNLIENSGHGLEARDAGEPWADGITLHNCWGGEVHDNHIIDATDVGIVSGGGTCSIVHNQVENVKRHVFGAITMHDFTLKGADHTGSVVAHNIVTGKNGMISFGFSLGIHPWHGWPLNGVTPYNTGGSVACNQVSGAIVNLEVDGVKGLTIADNQIGATGGSPRCNGPPVGYTSYPAHVLGSTLQAGYTEREYDACIP